MFGLEPVGCERRRWKVLEVGGEDDVCTTTYRRRDDMAVVGIGKTDRGNQIFEAGNQGIPDMGVHEPASAFEAGCRNVFPATQQRVNPFVVDGGGPLGAIQVRCREFQQKVAQWRRIQYGGVEKRDRGWQWLITHVEFLGVGDKFAERPAAGSIGLVLVSDEVVETHTAARTHLAVRHDAFFEEADEEGTRDIEEVGCLPGRRFGVRR